jgi:hypothetical protein
MNNALIWYTWFVWSNILSQIEFQDLYNSKNINEICNKEYDLIICAWVKAVKWWANKNPEEDLDWINKLIENLKTIKTKKFVLISTVDIYPNPFEVDEDFDFRLIDQSKYHPYWKNRLYLEEFIKNNFENYHIIRLPWLFWNNIKKNIIYDLLNDNQINNIIPNFKLQYYYLNNIWNDIIKVINNNIKVINFNSEPIESKDIIKLFWNIQVWENSNNPIYYNYYTKHWSFFSSKENYMYSKENTLKYIKTFIKQYKK